MKFIGKKTESLGKTSGKNSNNESKNSNSKKCNCVRNIKNGSK